MSDPPLLRFSKQIVDVQRFVFVTGGTGYIGRRATLALLANGHRVRALARPGSQHKLPAGCEVALGNALDCATFADDAAAVVRVRPWPLVAKRCARSSLQLKQVRRKPSRAC